jgi:hypothetical protein
MANEQITMRTKPASTIAGLKRLADEMPWMLELLISKEDTINIAINRDNGEFKITLNLSLPEKGKANG